MYNPIAYVAAFLMLIAMALAAAAQPETLISYGFGKSQSSVGIWKSCSANSAGDVICFSVTSNKQCSELGSRMKTTGAFSILSIIAGLSVIISVIAETRGTICPLQHLCKILYGWNLIPLIVAICIAIGTMVARLCSDPQPLTERNGKFESCFYLLCASFMASLCSMGFYMFWLSKRDVKEEDDKEKGFADL